MDTKYLKESIRNNLADDIKRWSAVFQPLPCQRERKIALDFVPVYKNPLANKIEDKIVALLPRIYVF